MGLHRLSISSVKERRTDFSVCKNPRVTTYGVSMYSTEMFPIIISANQQIGLKYAMLVQFFESDFA